MVWEAFGSPGMPCQKWDIPYDSAPFTAISIGHMMINSPVFWGVNFLDKPIPYPIYPDSESGIPRNTRWVRICFFGGSLRLISG